MPTLKTTQLDKFKDELFSNLSDQDLVYSLFEQWQQDQQLKADLSLEVRNLLWAVVLPRLDQPEVLTLFSGNLNLVFTVADLNLIRKLRGYLARIPLDERDPFKNQVRHLLMSNSTYFSQKLIVNGKQTVEPTLGNWLRLLLAKLSNSPSKLQIEEFLMSDSNCQSLTKEQLNSLRSLYYFFLNLAVSSYTLLGFENVRYFSLRDGRQVKFEDAQFIDLANGQVLDYEFMEREFDQAVSQKDQVVPEQSVAKQPVVKQPVVEQSVAEQPAPEQPEPEQPLAEQVVAKPPKQTLKVKAAVAQSSSKTTPRQNIVQQGQQLELAIENKQLEKVINILIFSALQQELWLIIEKNPKLHSYLGEGQTLVKDDPATLVSWLRIILEDKLGLDSSLSAEIGEKVGVNLGGLWGKLAYFSIPEKKFIWNPDLIAKR